MSWTKILGFAALTVAGLVLWSSAYVWLGCTAQPFAGAEFTFAQREKPKLMLAAAAATPGYARPPGIGMLDYVADLPDHARHDLARFLNQEPGDYPYFATVRNYWTNYCAVSKNLPGGFLPYWQAHVRTYVTGLIHSAEFGVWGLYRWATGRPVGPGGLFGVASAARAEARHVHAIVDGRPADEPYARVLQRDGTSELVALPHGRGLQTALRSLAATDARILELAGNDIVLLTAMVPAGWDGTRPAPGPFASEVPGGKLIRMGLLAPVNQLLANIRIIEASGGAIEAVYP